MAHCSWQSDFPIFLTRPIKISKQKKNKKVESATFSTEFRPNSDRVIEGFLNNSFLIFCKIPIRINTKNIWSGMEDVDGIFFSFSFWKNSAYALQECPRVEFSRVLHYIFSKQYTYLSWYQAWISIHLQYSRHYRYKVRKV